jgi:2-polyprenyl-3-methyl-5-hydroxy-6-metoxy-1,4-benzoquinol methylase
MAACESFQIEPDAPRGPFDFVILLEVFEHLLKPFEELSAITSTMGPHGMLLIHSELLVRPGAFRAVQGLVASALFLTNIAAARAIGQCNFRYAGADSQMIEAANLRKLDRTGAGRG